MQLNNKFAKRENGVDSEMKLSDLVIQVFS